MARKTKDFAALDDVMSKQMGERPEGKSRQHPNAGRCPEGYRRYSFLMEDGLLEWIKVYALVHGGLKTKDVINQALNEFKKAHEGETASVEEALNR